MSQAGLKLLGSNDLPTLASRQLELQGCVTVPAGCLLIGIVVFIVER